MFTIHNLQIIYIEPYDVLYTKNKNYEVLNLLGKIAIDPITVPTTYCGITIIKIAILRYDHFESFFKGLAIFCMCASKILFPVVDIAM
jgi:hypothetical protein